MVTLIQNKSYKAIAGAVFAFLVFAGSFSPLYVSAEDVPQNFTVWIDGIDGKLDSLLESYVASSGNPELQASYYGAVVACSAWSAYAQYCYHSIDALPPGDGNASGSVPVSGLWFGWYYLPNDQSYTDPKSCTIFGYGYNGDAVALYNKDSVIVASASDFTIQLDASVPDFSTLWINAQNPSNGILRYALNYEYNNQFYYQQYWSGVSATGIFLDSSFSSGLRPVAVSIPSSGAIVLPSYDVATYVKNPTISDPVPLCGQLYNAPSTYTNYLVYPGSTSDINDIVDTIHDELFTDFPNFMPDLWEDLDSPATTDSFDDLTFPPYIPDVDFHDVEIPSETLPTGLTDGAGFWFSAFSTMVEAFNLKSFVILFLCIMLLMVILKI